MLLPFPVLLRSHIQTRKKLALLGLLALGIFITIIQVIRIRTVKNLANYLDSASLIMWSAVENNLGIIGMHLPHFLGRVINFAFRTDANHPAVASIPTLAPLFKYYAEKTQKSSTANSRSRSLHALYPSRGTRDGSIPLGSGIDRTTHAYASSGEAGSEEFILSDVAEITKTTKVRVSAERRDGTHIVRSPGTAL